MQYPSSWQGGLPETVCGGGSKRENMLPCIEHFKGLEDSFILEIGCGDLNFAKNCGLLDSRRHNYTGVDVRKHDSWEGFNCHVADATNLPEEFDDYDVVIIRDVMIHLSNDQNLAILDRIAYMDPSILYATSYNVDNNERPGMPNAGHKALNLLLEPYNFKEPSARIQEHAADKYLGVWVKC